MNPDMVNGLALLDQRRNNPVDRRQFLLCQVKTLSRLNQDFPVFMLSISGAVNEFPQSACGPVDASVAYVRRHLQLLTVLFHKIRAYGVAQIAGSAYATAVMLAGFAKAVHAAVFSMDAAIGNSSVGSCV